MYQTNTLKERRAILLGMIIGDGCISSYKNKSFRLVIRHSKKQEEFLMFKKELIESIFYNQPLKVINVQNGLQIQKCSKLFRIYKKWFYTNGVKDFSKVLKYLDLKSVAIWYMDDGSLTAKKHEGKIHGYELTLNTYISREQNQLIIDWFKLKYDIQFTQTKSKGKYRLRMGTKEARKFCELIKEYVIPSMEYKLI